MKLHYQQVEDALAAVCNVSLKGRGAFRARLRHLRNIGLPQLPKPGSGQRISYSERQALEMLLALEIENAGHSPKKAAFLAPSIVRMNPYGQHEGKDCYIVIRTPDSAGFTQAVGFRQLVKVLTTGPAVLLIINLSELVRKLQPALKRSVRKG